MSPERAQLVDFTYPVSYFDLTFKSGLPREVVPFSVLLEPFDVLTWVMLVSSSALILATLFFWDKASLAKGMIVY